jgi:peptidyl-dipeptidase Dcp
MRNFLICTATLLVAFAGGGCATTADMDEPMPQTATPSVSPGTNPLLAEWTGPYGGVPPFDRVEVSDFQSALQTGMDRNLAEIDAIATNPAPPTFANTIEAMERSGAELDRVLTKYSIWSSTMSGPEFQAVQREMAPRLAAFSDQISQNEPLFRRVETLYNSPEKERLTPEEQRLLWLYHNNFVRAGARLDETAKARLSEIN